MDLRKELGSEDHQLYKDVALRNYRRYQTLLETLIEAALEVDPNRAWLTHGLIKAINLHAIVALHEEAGQYRSTTVTVGSYHPPPPAKVEGLMDSLIHEVNGQWHSEDPVALAAHCLWKINYIHPFPNGNGRTARGVCYFVLCVKLGGLLPGSTNLIELMAKPHRREYVEALEQADNGDVVPLMQLVNQLLGVQLTS